MWIHINFWFKRPKGIHRRSYYLTPSQQKKFHYLLRKIISNPFIQRKFFLYEPSPNCFLAIEIKDYLASIYAKIMIKVCKRVCKQQRLKFIRYIDYKLNSQDEKNGEYFLNCLNAFINLTLALKSPYPPWLKKFALKKLRLTAHIVHCCLNQITNSRRLERKFYKAMYKTYKCK